MSPWRNRVTTALASVLLVAATVGQLRSESAAEENAAKCASDERCRRLRSFFERYRSPLSDQALFFIEVAEKNQLDWRLLPGIAMVESGGKAGERANIFGWNSGRTRFASVEHAIDFVASRFSLSPLYAGKTALQILHRYNPHGSKYQKAVTGYMTQIASDPVR